ncbi:hypothetical protein [Rhizobium leguminosarum]|uniref:hypothetical protein n=1 Tax=Rhizobium leguminosarum TaxID=384 RepID=UPI0012BCD146|nr:hypothetical protein [Rhizobium leguminosarum]WFT88394.1 hypothetical protein QA638_12660 [Rhizobium leguminosarum]
MSEAVANVAARLHQMRQLWDDAAEFYFHPRRFALCLQSCITTARTVTFILQSNKTSIEGFDGWYGGYQNRWGADPIMRWAKEARNSIEKRGDLATHSEVKASIVASYLDGPETNWVPQALFAGPDEVFRAIPQKYRDEKQIRDHGTLLIERRWVDSELPKTEVLEALAHVYAEFVELLQDLCSRLAVPVPRSVSDRSPASMQPLIMDRALYLSMRDGSERGFRLFAKALPLDAKLLKKRYGNAVGWNGLLKAQSFAEVCEIYFSNACSMMLRDHYHRSFAFLFSRLMPIRLIGIDHPDRASRYVLMRELAQLAKILEADGVILVSEAWTAKGPDIPKSGYAVEAETRGEALMLNAADASGFRVSMQADVKRKKNKKHKVKSLSKRSDGDGFQFILAPFLQVWGKLDLDEVAEYDAKADALRA